MVATARIAVIGDFDPAKETHRATVRGLEHVPGRLEVKWVGTDAVDEPEASLRDYHGIWIAPGSPYRNMEGALEAIRFARERGVPLVGT